MAANRVYTPEEKLKIVLEGMSGTISVSDLCRKYDLKPARFYYWKDQLMNSAPEIFENRDRKVDEDRIRAEKDNEIARLKATIANVVSANLEIKKRDWRTYEQEFAQRIKTAMRDLDLPVNEAVSVTFCLSTVLNSMAMKDG